MCDDRRTDTCADYISCIKALTTVCPPTEMEDICIALDENGGLQMLEYLTDLLDPLLVFGNLAHFSFSCPMVGLVADDYDFSVITHAWPKLQTFKLWQAFWDPCVESEAEAKDSDSDGTPIPTPEVLESFRKQCPDLRELMLPHLDFDRDADARTRHARNAGPSHGLKLLAFRAKDLGGEDEEDWVRERTEPDHGQVAKWARYILDLFPKLDADERLTACTSMWVELGWTEVFKRAHGLRMSQNLGSSLLNDVQALKPSRL